MVFSAEEYIDKQFLSFQGFISKLSSAIPVLNPGIFKDEKQLIRALVVQNKAYAKKILDLFEELSNEGQPNGGGKGQLDALNTSKSFEIQSATNQRSSIHAEEDREVSDVAQLERKVDYLNSLYMQTKKQNEEKDNALKALTQQNSELVAEKERIDIEKERLESDIQELMDEFAQVKEKYEEQLKEIKEMDKYIAELKKKGPGRETPLKPVVENERIPELNEEIEELKEKLEQRDKVINELKIQIGSMSPKKPKVDEFPQLQEKILDLGLSLRELRTVLLRVCTKAEVVPDDRSPKSPTRLRRDKLGKDELGEVLEKEYIGIVEGLRKMALDLLNQPTKQVVITRSDSAKKATAGSSRRFREELHKMNQELKGRTQITLDILAKENRDQLVAQLEEEIEKNRELKGKNEKLSFTLQSVLLAVQDELDRLALIHEYARKSTSAEEFRLQIQNCKTMVQGLLTTEIREDMSLDDEYVTQRKLWQEKNDQQAQLFKEDLVRLREEIENQKEMTLKQEQELNEQIEVLKADLEESQRLRAEETEQYEERIAYLDREQENLNNYLEEIKRGKAEVENILSEREDTILNYSKTISEWQVKCGYLESDIRKALNDKSKMQDLVFEKDKEIERMKTDNSQLQNNIRNLTANVEGLERNVKRNEQEISQKAKRIEELQMTIEEENLKWRETNDQIKTEYREYVEETEKTTEELKENYERLIAEYNTQLEDLRKYTEQMRKAHENQTQDSNDEIRALSQVNEDILEKMRIQADTIRSKEEKLVRVEDELRKLEFKNRTMEDSLTEMNSIKDKNRKYFDMLSTSNVELNTLKIESQSLVSERNEALEKANKIEKAYIELREELRKAMERNDRSKEALQEDQAEIRALKDELDKSHRKLMDKERELRGVNEEYQNQSRTTIGYKDETINRLKSDLKQVTNDYESLRREYQNIIETNEEAMLENEKLKQIALDKELTFNEIEKLNNLNDELLVQNEQLKAENRRIEDEYEREKRSLVSEINNLKNKNLDLQTTIQKRLK